MASVPNRGLDQLLSPSASMNDFLNPWDDSPPPDETPAQRTAREKREFDAQNISNAIDEDLKRQRSELKKEKGVIKLLLVGQAHSGKSTTLKNFRLKYAPADWERERPSWRAVVQLNLIRNVLAILDAVQREMNRDTVNDYPSTPITVFNDKHQLLRVRLAALRQIEADLQRRLGAGSEEFRLKSPPSLTHSPLEPTDPAGFSHLNANTERAVRSWQDALESVALKNHSSFDGATEALSNCQQDIRALWDDEIVQSVISKHKVFSQDSSGFFIHETDRIATRSYEPTDDDILRARLRTVGVQEHRLSFKRSSESKSLKGPLDAEWILYDVGGCRTQRAAWIPYFDSIHALIFLAPVSCFDERLEEDPRVNRLQDSLILWDAICTSPLLLRTTFILFLNKCDLLRKKMKTGIKVKDYLTSYGDRPNDAKTFVKYLQAKFKDKLFHQQEPINRNFYSFLTSVVDAKATSATLTSVQDGIFREHLSESNFL
jgi:hypothetical protein